MARHWSALRGASACYNLCSGRSGPLLGANGAVLAPRQLTPAAAQPTHVTPLAFAAAAEPADLSEYGTSTLYHGHWPQVQNSQGHTTQMIPPQLNFDDAQSAFAKHSGAAVLRSMGMSFLCTVKPLVDNADAVLASLKSVCGDSVVNAAIRRTLFAHFCAGETAEEVQPLVQRLRASGVGSILAYSVESDVDADAAAACHDEAAEAHCDKHLKMLVESVWAARADDGCGFAAVKVTALGQAHMLEAVSAALSAGRPLCRLPDCQLGLMDAAIARLTTLAQAASKAGVRLLIDAEQSYLQPAIDLFALELQRQFNSQQPVVYNTFQAYRKDSHERLLADRARADAEGWRFGAKLVRGAYMVLERQRAAQLEYESPIHETKAATDANYDRCVGDMLRSIAAGSGAEAVVAGHNQRSIQAAAAAMHRLGLPPQQPGVHFAQLMGMCDSLTYTLANNGFQVVKYLPYGPLDRTLPYLIRRAQENSDIMGGVGQEVRLLRAELWRRATARLPRRPADIVSSSSSTHKDASSFAV